MQPSAKACAVASIAPVACMALVATMPTSQGGSSAESAVATGYAEMTTAALAHAIHEDRALRTRRPGAAADVTLRREVEAPVTLEDTVRVCVAGAPAAGPGGNRAGQPRRGAEENVVTRWAAQPVETGRER